MERKGKLAGVGKDSKSAQMIIRSKKARKFLWHNGEIRTKQKLNQKFRRFKIWKRTERKGKLVGVGTQMEELVNVRKMAIRSEMDRKFL